MIEEPEIRDLFAQEAADCLERLERGLMTLEQAPGDSAVLEHLFRQAHSLKGSAASLGLGDIETVAHQFEDALDAARKGRHPLTPGRADQLYRGLDILRGLVQEAVSGKPSGLDLRAALADLKRAPAEASPSASVAPPEAAARPAEAPPVPSEDEELRPSWNDIDASATTIRVETARLDHALAGLGDLVVTSARLGLRRKEAENLRELWRQTLRQPAPTGLPANGRQPAPRFDDQLELLIRALADDQARLEQITEQLREEIQAMRLVSLAPLFQRVSRLVRDLVRQQGKEVELQIEGEDTTADRRLLERLMAPLTHLLRNAIDHGIETPPARAATGKPALAKLAVRAFRQGPNLELSVSDDGQGLDFAAIARRAKELGLRSEEQLAQATEHELSALVFLPAFTTRTTVSGTSGRGTGLDAVCTEVRRLGGSVGVESRRGRGSTFRLRIPLTLAASQVVIGRCGERLFAIPISFVERTLLFDASMTVPLGGQDCLEIDGALVPLSRLDSVLGGSSGEGTICLLLNDQSQRRGFLVESLLGVTEVVVKPFKESPLVGGASILPDGRICLLLQVSELLRQARPVPPPPDRAQRTVLLVEDSPTAAAKAKRGLEDAGFRVVLAKDGRQAWNLATRRAYTAIVSDIEMPHLNGLELTRRLRTLPHYAAIPILLVTSLTSHETRQAGLQAGASAYLGKAAYEDGSLVESLERLV